MDAGKLLCGVIRAKELSGTCHRIAVKVFLKD